MLDLAYSIADQNVATTKSIGIYNFSLHLARNLAAHECISHLTILSNRSIELGRLSGKTRVEEHNLAIRNNVGRILWDQWGVYRCAQKTGHPWLFLPKGFSSFLVRPPVQVAAYVHDIMGDFYRRRYPGFELMLESGYFARSLAATIWKADVIFTNTEFSKREIMDFARRKGMPKPRIIVAGYGFDLPELVVSEKKQERILLFASKWPHKRTELAVRFLNHWLRKSNYGGTIDAIGILSARMEKPTGSQWNWIGRVPPEQGREVIRRARAIVYVSEYEGFGMPPAEAVLEGTCPVFSDIPPLREVMDGTGFSFSNDSADSFVEAMNRALGVSGETIRTWADTLLLRHNWQGVTDKIISELSTV
jgi:glycosyltransferase involved in cell wall biosynthesis